MSEAPEELPVGIIACPKCSLPSLCWNLVCVRCGADLMPEPDFSDDDAMRHKQENAA